MKPVFKYALASLVLAAGSSGAYASVALPSTGNSDLVLFVRDNSNPNRVFATGLGVSLDSLLTNSAVGSTPGDATALRDGTPITVGVALPTFHSDDLATFLSTASSGYSFAILGADTVGSTSATNPWRYVGTNAAQFNAVNKNTTSNSNLSNTSGITGSLNTVFGDLNNALGAGSFITNFSEFNGDGSSGTFNTFGKPFGDDTVTVGSAAHLYMLTSSVAGGTGTSSSTSRIYQFADVTLGMNGTLTSASVGGPEVPLPAAVWLLGSALVGLGTVRRRRDSQAA